MSGPSESYNRALELTKKHHATSKTFNGRFLFLYAEHIKAVIEEHGCKTMLDYGCGKGQQYVTPMESGQMVEDYLGVEITKFDPGWPAFAEEPTGKFDIVVCTQVLGSIPAKDLPWVILRLYGFAKKVVYVGERLGPVRKQIHASMQVQMPHEWTHEQWANVLRRPDAGGAAYLHTRNGWVKEHTPRIEKLS